MVGLKAMLAEVSPFGVLNEANIEQRAPTGAAIEVCLTTELAPGCGARQDVGAVDLYLAMCTDGNAATVCHLVQVAPVLHCSSAGGASASARGHLVLLVSMLLLHLAGCACGRRRRGRRRELRRGL